ncbi:MAG TPA: polyhydroxyalkanoate depolymerase, partial [Bradyrhizobium sp.]|nr:polyhydroxyalkanoate depolymerase [Bradyrhizobium sp.]
RHIKQHLDLHNHLVKGDIEKAASIKTFYDEYFAVMDLTAEFYVETIRDVFQDHLLPQGKLTFRGRPVNPAAIKRMGLMTVEGEKDDICAIGQTLAAQDLCSGVRAYRRVHHMQAGVGHYGVFSGKKWNNEIYPMLRDFVHVNS